MEEFEDAVLTDFGIEQCEKLNKYCKENNAVSNADLLVTSPMRRTMSTATYSFPGFVNKIPWFANESLREQAGEA